MIVFPVEKDEFSTARNTILLVPYTNRLNFKHAFALVWTTARMLAYANK